MRGLVRGLAMTVIIAAAGYGLYRWNTRGRAISLPANAIEVTSDTKLAVGQEVVVEWKGRWYRGQILELRGSGAVRVHYIGWSDKWDEEVDRSGLRLDP
jgi:hypothetical protein